MNRIRIAALISAILVFAGCMPQMAELSLPPKRLSQYGYSFMPPNEPGWRAAGRDGQNVMLGKRGASRDETLVIMAGNIATPRFNSSSDFEAWVRDQLHRDAGSSERFTVQKEELSMIKHAGADCARTHLVSIDHLARKRSGGEGDMVLEILEFYCRHPDHDGTMTVLGYSQRAYPDSRDPEIGRKARALFDSLEFSNF